MMPRKTTSVIMTGTIAVLDARVHDDVSAFAVGGGGGGLKVRTKLFGSE
jgi:hypothetical protein